MAKYSGNIDYEELIEQSLRNVIYLALCIVEEDGLPGDNHFYITFKTDFPGVEIPENLKVQYPETMTIVMQNQFEKLEVRYNSFSVVLGFGGVKQKITVPYDSITYFADPYAKFGLNFEPEDRILSNTKAAIGEKDDSRKRKSLLEKGAEVISFDSFRRKK
ncbi:MAG: hypothetical protein IJ099_01805 [Alphaproteobacteria bacterium]|nr:hypothetical protein [Alphaproteobacteria bacterium]